MRESDLSEPVSAWLRARSFEVYAEVPINQRSADLVGARPYKVDEPHYAVVELKAALTEAVARQASRSIPFAHEVWVAVGTYPAKRGVGWKICESRGIGILSVKTGSIRRVTRSNLFEPYLELNRRNMKPGGRGGLTTSERTPAKDVQKAIVVYVTDHPRATWTDIYHVIPNHYAHVKSLRQHHNTTAVRRARKAAV